MLSQIRIIHYQLIINDIKTINKQIKLSTQFMGCKGSLVRVQSSRLNNNKASEKSGAF